LINHKPSLGSCQAPHKIWAVSSFIGQTNKQSIYIYYWERHDNRIFVKTKSICKNINISKTQDIIAAKGWKRPTKLQNIFFLEFWHMSFSSWLYKKINFVEISKIDWDICKKLLKSIFFFKKTSNLDGFWT